ncbi:MAG TPA: glycosyltransferase family 4 protein [Coleofasciculaceae cyanobacterium]
MKIVFVNPVGVMGGAERVLLTALAALKATKPSIQLYLIVCTSGSLVEQAQQLGVQVIVLPLPKQVNQLGDSAFKSKNPVIARLSLLVRVGILLPVLQQYLKEFRQAIQAINPDLIHSNGIKTHLLAALASLKSIPIIWHIHDFYSTRPLMAWILRWISDRATAGIAISDAVAQDIRATLPRLPISTIYNAVDVNYFSPEQDVADVSKQIPDLRHSFDTNTLVNHTIRVGLVATFARWKGHDIFLDAADQLLHHQPDLNVHFYIIGSPIYKTKGSQFSQQESQDKAAALQIADKVEFIDFQFNIAEVYRNLDIVVHTSTQPEPFGLAIVEAMACGKPVIVSQAGGAAELFTDNYDAIGIPPGDRTALASAIQQLIESPQLRQRLSKNARVTVLKRFSSDRLGEQILGVYEKFTS